MLLGLVAGWYTRIDALGLNNGDAQSRKFRARWTGDCGRSGGTGKRGTRRRQGCDDGEKRVDGVQPPAWEALEQKKRKQGNEGKEARLGAKR
jgi:hypothetical protein